MRDPLFPSSRRTLLHQLPWWLAGLAFAMLGVMATAAWRAADAQRRDAEGARRQLAVEFAAQAGRRLQELEAAAVPVAEVRERWFSMDQEGDGADWVYGPWPQPPTELSRKFEEAQAWFRSGRLTEAARRLDEVFAAFSAIPESASSPSAVAAAATAMAEENSRAGTADSGNGRGAETARSAAVESGAFTTAGLPLKPLALRLRLALLSLPAAAAPEEGAAGEKQDQAPETERRRVARELLDAALTFPSVLTSALIGEAARELEKVGDSGEDIRISEARQRASLLENLRQTLRQERGAVSVGVRWIGGNSWHLERGTNGAIAIRSRAELSRIAAAAAGIGGSGVKIAAGVGVSADWPLQALLDGVDVQGFPGIPEHVMASVSSGSWRVDAVCEDPASAFAGLDQQRGRQRWLIGGTAVFLTAAMAGFLWVLERQRRLNVMMSNFVAAVSHELRAPVASVGLLAERLHAGRVPEAEEQSKYHGLIEGECRRISATIENVLAFSRLERRQAVREFELSDLRALLEDAARLFQTPAADRHVRIQTTLPPDPVEMEIDPMGLRQAVINLLDNALKFSPPHSTIRLRLEVGESTTNVTTLATSPDHFPAPGAVSIIVSDQGPGVPEAESSRIFDPFYRPGSELRRGTSGIGLGLAIVRATARSHGGSISVRRLPGSGAEFSLRLLNPEKTGP